MLKRREKRRYVSITCGAADSGGGVGALAAIQKRHAELFGSIALEKAALRLIKENENGIIMRCSLAEAEHVLATMALCDPPIVTLDMSSSVKRLKRRLVQA